MSGRPRTSTRAKRGTWVEVHGYLWASKAPTQAICCQGHIMSCPLFSFGCPRTSMEATWYQHGTRGSLVGDQEIPGKFSEHSGDHW